LTEITPFWRIFATVTHTTFIPTNACRVSVTSGAKDLKKGRDKLVHQCFRIEDVVIEELKQEAQKRMIPLSHMVNIILKNHVVSERYFVELGFVPVSRDIIKKIFSGIEEKYLVESGKEVGSTIAKEYISYFFGEVNSYTLIQFLEVWFARFVSFRHQIEGSQHFFSLKHDISMKYSIFLSEFLKSLIESIANSLVRFNVVTQNTITFSFQI
jgi:hypothetical protein